MNAMLVVIVGIAILGVHVLGVGLHPGPAVLQGAAEYLLHRSGVR